MKLLEDKEMSSETHVWILLNWWLSLSNLMSVKRPLYLNRCFTLLIEYRYIKIGHIF